MECNLEKLDYYKFCNTKSINNKNILVSNTGYTGSMGFEIYINNIDAESIWSLIFPALMQAPLEELIVLPLPALIIE